MKRVINLALILILILSCGCSHRATPQNAGNTKIFTDSLGRKVQVKQTIHRIAPSGPMAQVICYSYDPDLLVGIPCKFSKLTEEFIPEKYRNLPIMGQFYGNNTTMNYETLATEKPEILLDLGEVKQNMAATLDKLQERSGIPTIFIKFNIDCAVQSYRSLGELLGTKRGEELAKSCDELLQYVDKIRDSVPENRRKRVYMAMGESGLNSNGKHGFHAEILEKAGANNIVPESAISTGGGVLLSMETLISEDPDIILVSGEKLYEKLIRDPVWQKLRAIKTGEIFKIPDLPYSFTFSTGKIIGSFWLAQLLYPDRATKDIKTEVQKFYHKFYKIDLTEEQYQKVMLHALRNKK